MLVGFPWLEPWPVARLSFCEGIGVDDISDTNEEHPLPACPVWRPRQTAGF